MGPDSAVAASELNQLAAVVVVAAAAFEAVLDPRTANHGIAAHLAVAPLAGTAPEAVDTGSSWRISHTWLLGKI